jgi:hypothetical protein
MNEVRFLENKFAEEIQKHIIKALPNLNNSFMQFRESTDFEDCKLSFDLVFNLGFTVSIRIRKYDYIKYNDLTIRSKSRSNGYTEIDKIKDGLAQIYFYAYMNLQETELIKIRIVNVGAIRKLIKDGIFVERKNNDNTEFVAIKFSAINENNGAIYQYDQP